MKNGLSLLLISCAGVGSLWVGACTRSSEVQTPNPVTESYRLLDHDQKGKATLILEKEIKDHPDNMEARLVLGSAYVGEAGLDVLTLYNSFQDILFSKSLSDRLWHNDSSGQASEPSPGNGQFEPEPKPTPSVRPSESPETATEEALDKVDTFLNDVRKTLELLDRMPSIPRSKWPYLDRAFEVMDPIGPDKDASIYRLFVRIIYVKSYLSTNILRDRDLLTRDAICQLDFEELRNGLLWISSMLDDAGNDFEYTFPGKAAPFIQFHANLIMLSNYLSTSDQNTPIGAETSMIRIQQLIRNKLHCQYSN